MCIMATISVQSTPAETPIKANLLMLGEIIARTRNGDDYIFTSSQKKTKYLPLGSGLDRDWFLAAPERCALHPGSFPRPRMWLRPQEQCGLSREGRDVRAAALVLCAKFIRPTARV
jgi:hypothetical protein